MCRLTYRPKKLLPVEESRRPQDRLRHLFLPNNRRMIGEFRAVADRHWERLLQTVRGNREI